MNLMKNFCMLLTALYIVNICPAIATTIDLSFQFQVNIINALPNNNIPLWFHCASKEDDYGYQILKVDKNFHFEFTMNFFQTTLYFCHFWWGKEQNMFDVFTKHLSSHCSNSHPTSYCYWKVKIDGFYMGPQLDKLQKMHDWK